MKNPCKHRKEDVILVAGIQWCEECGAIRYRGDAKPRWKSPGRSVFDMQHIFKIAKEEARKELRRELCELIGAKMEEE